MQACKNCFKKQLKIDKLEKEVVRLKSQARAAEIKAKEGPFGSSTPSSKRHFKPSAKNKTSNMGGAKKGHKGHGRKFASPPDREEFLPLGGDCPNCGNALKTKGTVHRTVRDIAPVNPETVDYVCEKKWCPHCNKTFQSKPEQVLPKTLLGNRLIAQAISLHFEQGLPLGRIENIYGIHHGSLIHAFHRVARFLNPVMPLIIGELRAEEAIHADETGWRIDGGTGYAWLFCSARTSIFRFAKTRASTVPKEILGTQALSACLVRDRYSGYNFFLGPQQYCFAHLLRDVEDLEKEFEDQTEVVEFVNRMATLLSDAMKLRNRDISDQEYYRQAREIKKLIIALAEIPCAHLGIRDIQSIFQQKNHPRLFQWVENRNIPPDNNRGERELRPSVIARKVSFGSQSENGSHTRSTLMSVIHTAKKRQKCQNTVEWIKSLLDWWVCEANPQPEAILQRIG